MSAAQSQAGRAERVVFFDNLRWLLVVLVILEHASYAYIHIGWWPVADSATSLVAGWISALSDACSMPLLFFISGYFAIPAIARRGSWPFLKDKLGRLGIPWLVCLLVVCPILPLIYHFTRDGFLLSRGYWELWLVLLRQAAGFHTGLIASMDGLMQADGFYQRYMWFLSLLLAFFSLFGLLYALKKNWFQPPNGPVRGVSPSVSATLKILLGLGALTALGSFLVMGAVLALNPGISNPEPLFTLGNLLQVRPTRLFPYMLFFGLGVLTYRDRWIEQGRFPGHFRTWAVAFTGLSLAYLFAYRQTLRGPAGQQSLYAWAFLFLLPFLTVAALGFFTSFGLRYWQRSTRLDRSLAANSYAMYLSHYPFVLVSQLALLGLPGLAGLVKFALVSVLSLAGAYLSGRYLINAHPRAAVLAGLALFLAMAVWVRP